MASLNEYSGRYSIIKDRFYRPDDDSIRAQSTRNRQGGDDLTDRATSENFLSYLDTCEANYAGYEEAVQSGVSRELARIGLPLATYTEWYWKIDLHNLFHFLSLRMDSHAQKEIRDYADAMFRLIRPIVPVACAAFLDYDFHSVRLSRLEVESLRTGLPLDTANARESEEWEEKRKKLHVG